MDEEILQTEDQEVLLQDEIQNQENSLEVVETQNVTMVATTDEIVLAIEKQTEAIHIQFSVLIAVLLFLKLWRRKN